MARMRRQMVVGQLLSDLKATGVVIEGEEALNADLEAAENWHEEINYLARTGRKKGMRFLKRTLSTTDCALRTVLNRHRFSEEQVRQIVPNVILDGETE